MLERSYPLVSVVVPSYGRDEILRRCLTRVLAQEYEPFEVIVVHEGARPFSWREGKVRILHRGKPVGSPQAKNLGIEAAKGSLVVFIDDDAYPLENQWLSQLVEPFASDSLLGAVGGRIMSPNHPFGNRDLVGRIVFNSLGMYKIVGNFGSPTTCVVDHLSSCNLAVARKALKMMEPPYFDPVFKGGAFREEADFCLRLRAAGFSLKHISNATAIHEPASHGGNRKRGQIGCFWHGYGEATLFFKHFYNGRISSVARFLLQESLFNWMPPQYQMAKTLGIASALLDRSGRHTHPKDSR